MTQGPLKARTCFVISLMVSVVYLRLSKGTLSWCFHSSFDRPFDAAQESLGTSG